MGLALHLHGSDGEVRTVAASAAKVLVRVGVRVGVRVRGRVRGRGRVRVLGLGC